MVSETVLLKGHILDNLTLPKVLDLVINFGGDYRIEKIDVGHARQDTSRAQVQISAANRATLNEILDQVVRTGAEISGTLKSR